MESKRVNDKIYSANYIGLKSLIILSLFVLTTSLASAITVSSLSQLKNYLDDDNVNVVMSPGTYTITTTEVESGVYGPNPVLEFSGDNTRKPCWKAMYT